MRYAYENTDGYRELYRKAGLTPDDIRNLADIKHLPFTTKQMLQSNLEAFSVKGVRRRYVTTGGSTGIPFGFYQCAGMRSIEQAFVHNAWEPFGYRLGMRTGVLRGGFIGSPKNPFLYDPYRQELHLSTYYLNNETVTDYVSLLRQYKIDILQAYPSALNLLVGLIEKHRLEDRFQVKTILLASENAYDWQLRKADEVLKGAKLFDFYGQSERVIFAAWCDLSRTYHVNPFYGVTELVHDPTAQQDTHGRELVGTSFHNRATPFIRYRTMDFAVSHNDRCDSCNCCYLTLSKIIGRRHEFIVTGTGRYISMTALNMHDRIFDPVVQFQFFQDLKGRVVFKFVPKPTFSRVDIGRIRDGLTHKLGDDVELQLQSVESIPRTTSGKYRFLDQRLRIQQGDVCDLG